MKKLTVIFACSFILTFEAAAEVAPKIFNEVTQADSNYYKGKNDLTIITTGNKQKVHANRDYWKMKSQATPEGKTQIFTTAKGVTAFGDNERRIIKFDKRGYVTAAIQTKTSPGPDRSGQRLGSINYIDKDTKVECQSDFNSFEPEQHGNAEHQLKYNCVGFKAKDCKAFKEYFNKSFQGSKENLKACTNDISFLALYARPMGTNYEAEGAARKQLEDIAKDAGAEDNNRVYTFNSPRHSFDKVHNIAGNIFKFHKFCESRGLIGEKNESAKGAKPLQGKKQTTVE